MNIVPFKYQDHADKIAHWGKKYQFPFPSEDFIPDLGCIVNDAACGFLYLTNSKLCLIEWIFANPEKTAEERKEALDGVIHFLTQLALGLGKKAIFSYSATEAYRKVLDRNGFVKTDSDMTHHVKRIGG